MSDKIKWIVEPKKISYARVRWADCPRWIQKEFNVHRELFKLMNPYAFLWRDYFVSVKAGSISDLASGMHFLPRRLAARTQHNNWLDHGAHVHDMGHLGVAEFPDIERGRQQCHLFDRLMYDLWQDQYEDRERIGRFRRWYQRGQPTRKYLAVRAASVVLWSPDYRNEDPSWMSITKICPAKQVEVIDEDA